jgi:hypothetical protein
LKQHGVGAVYLVADRGEVVADRADVSAARYRVLEKPGGVRAVRVGGRAGMVVQLVPQALSNGSCLGEPD